MTAASRLTAPESEALARRVLDKIPDRDGHPAWDSVYGDARLRVCSDLEGLLQHLRDYCEERGLCADPCPDIARYAFGLRHAAARWQVWT